MSVRMLATSTGTSALPTEPPSMTTTPPTRPALPAEGGAPRRRRGARRLDVDGRRGAAEITAVDDHLPGDLVGGARDGHVGPVEDLVDAVAGRGARDDRPGAVGVGDQLDVGGLRLHRGRGGGVLLRGGVQQRSDAPPAGAAGDAPPAAAPR